MTRPLKVFGLGTISRGQSVRRIVATTTQAQAARLMQVKAHELRTYGSITHNDDEIATAMSAPGVVFERPDRYPAPPWVRMTDAATPNARGPEPRL